MKYLCALLCLSLLSCEPTLTAEDVLDKTIAYHDPDNEWSQFSGKLNIELQTPNNSTRYSQVTINLPEDRFQLVEQRDSTTIERTWQNGACTFTVNDSTEVSKERIEQLRGDCDRTGFIKDYYTYLYGLPMKLKDPGTQLHPEVKRDTFMGKEYLVLRVDYDPEVGEDRWYFYLDPETYAMEVYQFYKDETTGKGEYILLNEEEEYGQMKLPKDRTWYTNDGKLLGTDHLKSIDPIQ